MDMEKFFQLFYLLASVTWALKAAPTTMGAKWTGKEL